MFTIPDCKAKCTIITRSLCISNSLHQRYSINGDEPRQQSQLFMFPSDHIVERLFFLLHQSVMFHAAKKTEKPYFSAIQTLFSNNNYTSTPVCISETSWSTVNICLRKRPKNQGYRVCDTLRNPKDLNRGNQLPSM